MEIREAAWGQVGGSSDGARPGMSLLRSVHPAPLLRMRDVASPSMPGRIVQARENSSRCRAAATLRAQGIGGHLLCCVSKTMDGHRLSSRVAHLTPQPLARIPRGPGLSVRGRSIYTT